MLQYIYSRSISSVVFAILSGVAIWTVLNKVCEKNRHSRCVMKLLNFGVCILGTACVLYVTLFSRTPEKRELCLIPFYFLNSAKQQPEIYRSMLMNVLLFVPLGVTMPYALKTFVEKEIKMTILFSVFLSSAVETIQYMYYLGRGEVDDVICNLLGISFGCMSYLLNTKKTLLKKVEHNCVGESQEFY